MSFKEKMGDKKIVGQRIVNSDEALGVNFTTPKGVVLADIKLNALEKNPFQPRTHIDSEKLAGLCESLQANGLLQPIIVRLDPNNSRRFQIIAGHRRAQAARQLGWDSIRGVILSNTDDKAMQVDALIENVQREQLSIIDEAMAISSIMSSHGFKQNQIAKVIGKSTGYISQMLKLITLPETILIEIKDSNLIASLSLLNEISYFDGTDEEKIAIFYKMMNENLKRNDLRALISQIKEKKIQVASEKKEAPFVFSAKHNKITMKLNLNTINDPAEVIATLENLIEQLRKNKQ